MPGIVRKSIDKAGGPLKTASGDVFVNNEGAVRVDDLVASHGKKKHKGPKMIQGSSTVFINNKPVSRAGDKAECGHPASGSSDVSAD
jgi:uncharacterized Zn-binding protein involved in type VI secretion